MAFDVGIVSGRSARLMGYARIMMGIAFLYYGISKLFGISAITAFVGTKLPLPGLVFWLAVVIETGTGLLLLIGWKSRPVAAFLAFYCVFTALVFHTNFAVMPIRDHFFSNLVMAAGFLYLVATGPGAWALDNKDVDIV